MAEAPTHDGLRVVAGDDLDTDRTSDADEPSGDGEAHDHDDRPTDSDLESLRDGFVAGFNTRDLEEILALVHPDVECPDIRDGDGAEVLAEELLAIWERSPGAILTRAFVGGNACAVGWLPDEDGCWSRAALVCFDAADGLLTLVALPDDAAALDAAEADEPTGEELDEWSDWSNWERGEETEARPRP